MTRSEQNAILMQEHLVKLLGAVRGWIAIDHIEAGTVMKLPDNQTKLVLSRVWARENGDCALVTNAARYAWVNSSAYNGALLGIMSKLGPVGRSYALPFRARVEVLDERDMLKMALQCEPKAIERYREIVSNAGYGRPMLESI